MSFLSHQVFRTYLETFGATAGQAESLTEDLELARNLTDPVIPEFAEPWLCRVPGCDPGGASAMEEPAVNPGWRKSTYSDNGGSDCVEAGQAPGAVLIRDTKDNGAGPVLRVSAQTWRRFTRAVRARR